MMMQAPRVPRIAISALICAAASYATSARAAGVVHQFPHNAKMAIADQGVLKVLSCGAKSEVTRTDVNNALSKVQVIVFENSDWATLSKALKSNSRMSNPAVTMTGETRASLADIGVHNLACFWKRMKENDADKKDGPTLLKEAAAALKLAEPGIFLGPAATSAIYVNARGPAADLDNKLIAHEGVHVVLNAETSGAMIPGIQHIIIGELWWNGSGTHPAKSKYLGTPNPEVFLPLTGPGIDEKRMSFGLLTAPEVTSGCATLETVSTPADPNDGQNPAADCDLGTLGTNSAPEQGAVPLTDVPNAGSHDAKDMPAFVRQNATTETGGAAAEVKDEVKHELMGGE